MMPLPMSPGVARFWAPIAARTPGSSIRTTMEVVAMEYGEPVVGAVGALSRLQPATHRTLAARMEVDRTRRERKAGRFMGGFLLRRVARTHGQTPVLKQN